MKSKVCPICGDVFIPKSPRQKYCKKSIKLKCVVCGDEFDGECSPNNPQTCGKKYCKDHNNVNTANSGTKICKICGQEFVPKSSRQIYCNREITKICPVCGKSFTTYCRANNTSNVCSEECTNKLRVQRIQETYKNTTTKSCALCGKEFHPRSNTQIYCDDEHYRNCVICGKKFKLIRKNGTYPTSDLPVTCSTECAVQLRFKDGNPFQLPESRKKAEETYFKKTGYRHPAQNPDVQNKMMSTYESRTGYDCPSHNPHVRSKSGVSNKSGTSLERRVAQFLDSYGIEYQREYMISQDDSHHCFDFYLPKYNILVDADGIYYHSYIEDSNGKQVLEYYDEDRIASISNDYILHIIVESSIDKGLMELKEMIRKIDEDAFNYDDELFQWCRKIGFPYPEYTEDRLRYDYDHLCKYKNDRYIPQCLLGVSSIRQYHRSIWDAHVPNKKSPKEAWFDDNMLRQIIANRLIYKNDVDPSKILAGFNITKKAPRVSIFNPVLARYITQKYLSEFDEVFDPFSGFSGRMLGVCSTGKKYIGRDISEKHINESIQIRDFHQLNASLEVADILSSKNESYQCLFTCPPYSNKEIYGDETVFKSCDDWIDYILNKFYCDVYVFVVDHSDKYRIVETITNTSHFNKNTESIIVIRKRP